MIRSYQELRRINGFLERFRYLSVHASVGRATFGSDRYLNQKFYTSKQWRDIRHEVIVRDLGCDLGIEGREIHDRILIHHMNPMGVDDILDGDMSILNPDYLICTSHATHNAIHFGDENQLPRDFVGRSAGDTKLW